MNELTTKKPFHESIVDAIRNVSCREELAFLAELIKATKIPSNHQVIIDAWKDRMMVVGADTDSGVLESVLGQDYKRMMNSSKSLEEALKNAFDCLPLSNRFVGPHEKIMLLRNSIEKGISCFGEAVVVGAEIGVFDNLSDNFKCIFRAYWEEDNKGYRLEPIGDNRLEDWSDKW